MLLLLLAGLMLCLASESDAAFISPTKVFIQDGQTSASLSITNNSDEALVFTFEWERRVRSVDGKEARLLKEGETVEGYHPADPYLIYSPRRVVVEAGETQRLRILAQRPKDMAPGEYRSHLNITSESVNPPQETKVNPGEFGGTFTIRPAVSIPVMLRTGKTVIDVKIAGTKLVKERGADVAYVTMLNSSTRTIYGNSSLKCKTPGGEEITTQTNGFRLYAETKTSTEKFLVPEATAPSKCSSLVLDLFPGHEPGYRNSPIAAIKLK